MYRNLVRCHRETFSYLELVHNLADSFSALTDKPCMNSVINVKVNLDEIVKIPSNLEDGSLGVVAALLVTGDSNYRRVRISSLRELNVDLELVSDLRDNDSLFANDLGMVLRVNVDRDLVASSLLVKFFLFQRLHLASQSVSSSFHVASHTNYSDDVRVVYCGRYL